MSETITTLTLAVSKEVDDASASAQVVIQRNIQAIYQQVLQKVGRYLGTSTYTQVVTASTADYTPTDFLELIKVQYQPVGYSSTTNLEEITMKDYLDNHFDDLDGTPTKYVLNGLKVKLVPAPQDAGTLTIEYVPAQSALETSIIPDKYSDVIVMGACYRFFAYDSDPKAVDYKNLYDEALRSMINELATRGEVFQSKMYGIRSKNL